MADESDLQIKFGADISGLQRGVDSAKAPIADFSARVADLNAQLTATNRPLQDVAASAEKASGSTKNLSLSTSGATREFIVLGHEVMTGNFSRIPGSLMVLAERTGGLHSILEKITPATIAWGAAIAGLVAATYEWIASSERLAETQETVRGAMELNNQSLSYNKEQVEENIGRLRILADVSQGTAEKIAISFARAGKISEDLKLQLMNLVGDYAAATGEEAPKAAENLIKMFSEPDKGAHQLAETFTGILTPAQLDAIDTMKRMGASSHDMAAVLLGDVGPALDNFRLKHLTPFQRNLESIRDLWVETFNKMPEKLPGQSREDYWKGVGQPSNQQTPAAQEQQHQAELNDEELRGLDILKSMRLEHEQIDRLTLERTALVNAANAAMQKGDDDLAQKYQQGIGDLDGKIAKIQEQANRKSIEDAHKALEEKLAIARDEANTTAEIDRINLQSKRDMLQEEVAQKKITKQQALELEKQYAQQEFEISYQALQEEYALDGQTALQKKQVYDKIQILYAQHQAQMEKIALEGAAAQAKADKQTQAESDKFFKSMEQGMNSVVDGVLRGTQTWQQAMVRLFDDLLIKFVNDFIVKGVADWAAAEAQKLGITQAVNQAMIALGLQSAAEQATAQQGVRAAANTATVTSDAALTFAGVMANLSPLLGPAAAGPATASAGLVMAQIPQASLAVGAWNLPSDMVAQLHQGEMVVPRNFADGLRGNSGIGGGGDNYNINISLNAIDTQTGTAWLKSNMGVIAQGMAREMRNMNPSLAQGWRN